VRARAHGERFQGSFATFAEAAQVQRLVEAVVRSDRDRVWVDVPADAPDQARERTVAT
jgi:hypothetical protein